MVPHLQTTLTGSLLMLEKYFLNNQSKIEQWFRMKWVEYPPPFYSSVDLRNSGFKLAPVDTNLFPAGFNNLNPDFLSLCVQAIQSAMSEICVNARKILIIPEEHTRNLFYLESLATLKEMLELSGLETKIGSLNISKPTTIKLKSNKILKYSPLILQSGHLAITNFTPCVCLLNNDLSSGIPDILEQATKSLFVPPLKLGWANRLKSNHFSHYKNIAKEFADYIGFDSWLIDPLFENCNNVDFSNNSHDDKNCLTTQIDKLLTKIQIKYNKFNINKKPFVLIKSDTGTYGMGIMIVHNVDEIKNLNRKQRKKMMSNKGGSKINKVILQEGVYTFETTDDGHVCEPVAYMIDKHVVGGFYRVHSDKNESENLNAPGAHFEPLSFAKPLTMPNQKADPDAEPNRFYAYGVVARLATLAAALEISEVLKN